MPQTEWLLFDIGGVLEVVDDDWLVRFHERCAERAAVTVAQLGERLDRAQLPDITVRADAEQAYWDAFGQALDLGPEGLAAIRSDFWDAYCGSADEALLAEARSLVGRVGLAILSNSADGARREEDRRYAFSSTFDPIGYSHEIGVLKPDPRAFEIMLTAMNADAGHVLFIDDVQENVAAARALGMQAHRHIDTDETVAVIRAALGLADP